MPINTSIDLGIWCAILLLGPAQFDDGMYNQESTCISEDWEVDIFLYRYIL